MSQSAYSHAQDPEVVYENALSTLELMAAKYPDNTAIIYLGQKFSYSRLMDMVKKFAGALRDIGVRPDDKVMIYLSNCPQFLIAYFGAQIVGAVPVPISPIYTIAEIAYMINDSESETIVCEDINFRYVKQVEAKTCLKRMIVTNLTDLLPRWKYVVGRLFDRIPVGYVKHDKNVHSFTGLLRSSSAKAQSVSTDVSGCLAYILYTSGTTGFPKGVPGTHAGVVSIIRDYHEIIGKNIEEGGSDVLIMVSPLFHMLGKVTILACGLGLGITTVLMPRPRVDAILKAIERYTGTMFLGVPTLYRMILENERLDQYDLTSLKYCWSGGDVLPDSIYERWMSKCGVPIYQSYGSTEVGVGSLNLLDKPPILGSIGYPTPSRDTMIVDPESLEELPANTTGELLISSRNMTMHYWKKPEETSESFVYRNGKTWFRTKDFVRMDEDGLLYYVDRSSDIVKYKGYKVSCSEIESVLMNHPAVIRACVVGVPDDRFGERIKAIVVLKSDVRGISASELIQWCRERLISYKVPKYVEFRDMLPISKVGKLLRREIRDEELKRLKSQ